MSELEDRILKLTAECALLRENLAYAESVLSDQFSSLLTGPCPADWGVCEEPVCENNGCIVNHMIDIRTALASNGNDTSDA